ncbi:MAG: HpaII family restriction endonuclease [Muribaculaceae bacterium]|nr:HpaII family restriction endonuclease [Muribaculaceae bacterium]
MANIGEWSEVYAFFKLLADGRLYCGDGHLNRYDDKYYPILEIFRNDAPDRNAYEVKAAKKAILVAGETIHIEIPQKTFRIEAANLLDKIKTIGAGEYEETLKFMKKIKCGPVKAKSSDKADIRIVIHNLATGSKPELGYSIKSKLGGDSTLINSNKDASNFIFQIEGINDSQMRQINSLDKFKQKFDYIKKVGGKWRFSKISGETLRNNLTMLDLGMPRIIAACMEKYYTGQGSDIASICKKVTQDDPLHINSSEGQPMYEYKLKQFLLAFALGMTVSSPWYGDFNANGGYIVVKEDGDVICYHFFDRNDLEGYLFNNTKFDTPSTTRHEFGEVYKVMDSYFIKLNLQIRFIK